MTPHPGVPKRSAILLLALAAGAFTLTGVYVARWTQPTSLEIVTTRYDDGKLRSEYTVLPRTTQKHGTQREWNKDGRLTQMLTYENGLLDGPVVGWHENGQQAFLGFYSKWQQDGFWIAWHSNGEEKHSGRYEKGKKVATWEYFDERGEPTKKEVYSGDSVRGWKWANGQWEELGTLPKPH